MQITSVEIQEHTLRFRFEAGTSRGTLKEKKTWYLKLYNEGNLIGIGEAGPLKGLSIEKIELSSSNVNSTRGQLTTVFLLRNGCMCSVYPKMKL